MNNQARIAKMESLIQSALNPTHLKINDDSHKHIGHAGAATGMGHFTIQIAAPVFENKSLIEQHRMIYNALGDMMETDIHALRIVIEL